MKGPKIILTLVFLCLSAALAAQTLESLRAEVARAEEEIRKTNNLLSKTRSDKTVSQNQLKLIQNRIRNRRQIVDNLAKQASLINRSISSKNDTVLLLEKRIGTLRKEYAEMIRQGYKNYKINNYMAFLFSARDFNDATRRIAFMRRVNRMRQEQAARIDSVSLSLGIQIEDLRSKREELEKLQQSRNNELASLGKDEAQYKTSLNTLTRQESRLSSEIKNHQAKLNKLQQQIQQMIAEEARKNRNTQRSAAEEEQLAVLSGQFDQNRGKLPYPVRGGVIVDRYGIHPHPTQKGLMVNNKGVNIAGDSGSEVRAVFEGTVCRVFSFQGMGNGILIRHGNYYTSYGNLASVSVKTGDQVSLNQVIGRLAASSDSDDCVLNFTVWKETDNLNPENWLRKGS